MFPIALCAEKKLFSNFNVYKKFANLQHFKLHLFNALWHDYCVWVEIVRQINFFAFSIFHFLNITKTNADKSSDKCQFRVLLNNFKKGMSYSIANLTAKQVTSQEQGKGFCSPYQNTIPQPYNRVKANIARL